MKVYIKLIIISFILLIISDILAVHFYNICCSFYFINIMIIVFLIVLSYLAGILYVIENKEEKK